MGLKTATLRIGVDGGGTTTRAVIVDDSLRVLGRGEAASSNHYSVGIENAVRNVNIAVQSAVAVAGITLENIVAWGLGLAGACTTSEQAMLTTALAPLTNGKVLVIDEDAAAAQSGAFGGAGGAVCIAGTGANCFGVSADGRRARADGLGPLLGDRGSGYRIGEAALRAACAAHDGIGPATGVLDACFVHYAVSSVDELIQVVYGANFTKDRVASLFPVVVQCAREGDQIALDLLHNAGQDLAATTLSVLRVLSLRRVAVSGGVLAHETPVRASFEGNLHRQVPDIEICEPLRDAAVGAALLTISKI